MRPRTRPRSTPRTSTIRSVNPDSSRCRCSTGRPRSTIAVKYGAGARPSRRRWPSARGDGTVDVGPDPLDRRGEHLGVARAQRREEAGVGLGGVVGALDEVHLDDRRTSALLSRSARQLHGDVDDHVLLPADAARARRSGAGSRAPARRSAPPRARRAAGSSSTPRPSPARSRCGPSSASGAGTGGRPPRPRRAGRRRRGRSSMSSRSNTAARTSVGELPGARAERAQRPVDVADAGLVGQHRVRDAERQVLVPVVADPGLVADLGDQRLEPRAGLVHQQRARPSRSRTPPGSRRRP